MRQGTTPKHIFTTNIDASVIKSLRIIYAQVDNVLFVKRTEECVLTGNTIEVSLSQEETLKVDETEYVQIQLHVLTQNDEAITSDIMLVWPEKLLSKEVIV